MADTQKISSSELWRKIPPEEKLDLMARAHGKGALTSFIIFVVSSTLAIGLQVPWIMWGSLVAAPFIFQAAAGKDWKDSRPRIMLEYLAARSAARRYAYVANAQQLEPNFIFRGVLEEQFDDKHLHEALKKVVENNQQTEVWVSLFEDALIMMSERKGGAKLEFAHVFNDKLRVNAFSPDGESDYSQHRIVQVVSEENPKLTRRFHLTSRHAAALIVFEKRINFLIEEAKKRKENGGLSFDPDDATAEGLNGQ